MSAATLRRAAAQMRSDWDVARYIRPDLARMDPHWRRGLTWLAVADLFTNLADNWEQVGPKSRVGLLAVADAYLGDDQ